MQCIPSHPINYWPNCVEGVWWPCYIGSDIWFQDDCWEASSLGFLSFQRFPIWCEQLLKDFVSRGSPGEYSRAKLLLGRCFQGIACPFWSTVLQFGARLPTHPKLLDRVVSGASFLNECVLECNLFTGGVFVRQSVAVLCMLYTIRCNQMHHLYGAPLVP